MKGNRVIVVAFAAALLIGFGTQAFASGQQDRGTNPATGQKAAELTVTGNVSFQNLIHPVLKSGTTSYELLVPRFAVYESGIKEGQSVTVSGYKVTDDQLGPWHRSTSSASNAQYLAVTSATIDGKSYDVRSARPDFAYGQGYGPRGSAGPRGYRGMGPMMGYYGNGGPGRGTNGYGPGAMGYGYGRGPMYGQGYGPWSQGTNQDRDNQ
ncbi:MAG TPA: hypothetical protein VMV68_01540 [Spirochaetia bacterium]|nr:hypothetical protein [Spirochaetia bacterium]